MHRLGRANYQGYGVPVNLGGAAQNVPPSPYQPPPNMGLAGLPPMQLSAAQARNQVKKEAAKYAKQLADQQKEVQKIASIPYRTGLYVAIILGCIVLWFVYYDVLGQNKTIFGGLVILLCVGLFMSLGKNVKEKGAAVAGGIQLTS